MPESLVRAVANIRPGRIFKMRDVANIGVDNVLKDPSRYFFAAVPAIAPNRREARLALLELDCRNG